MNTCIHMHIYTYVVYVYECVCVCARERACICACMCVCLFIQKGRQVQKCYFPISRPNRQTRVPRNSFNASMRCILIDILLVYYAGLCHIIIHPMSKRVPRNSFNASMRCILLIYYWYIMPAYVTSSYILCQKGCQETPSMRQCDVYY